MKKAFICASSPFIMLVLCVISLMAVSHSAVAQILDFDKIRIEAGEISEEEKPLFEYVCTNKGDKTLTVTRITTTCGSCMKAEIDKNVLAAGEKAKIRLSYFPKGHPGKFERRIFVYTDLSVSEPTAVLELAISVKMGDDLTPYYPMNMGKIRMKTAELAFRKGRSEGICLEYLDVTGNDFRPQIKREFLPPYLKVNVVSPSELAADEDAVLEDSAGGKVGEICVAFDSDAFPEDRDYAEVPLMLNALGVAPSAATIKVTIR